MSRIAFKVFNLFVVAMMLLASCGGGAPGSSDIGLKEVSDHFSQTAGIENKAVAQAKTFYTAFDQERKALEAKYPLASQCGEIYATAGREIMEGRYDNTGPDGQPTGEVNAQFAINAVHEQNPNGLETCTKMVQDFSIEVTAWRQQNIVNLTNLWETERQLNNQYTGEIGSALATPLLARAGTEFMKTDLGKFFDPPKIWYPTLNLRWSVYDKNQCALLKEEYPGQVHWSEALGECKTIGQAAYDLIFRPPYGAATRDMINTGQEDYQLPTQPTVGP